MLAMVPGEGSTVWVVRTHSITRGWPLDGPYFMRSITIAAVLAAWRVMSHCPGADEVRRLRMGRRTRPAGGRLCPDNPAGNEVKGFAGEMRLR